MKKNALRKSLDLDLGKKIHNKIIRGMKTIIKMCRTKHLRLFAATPTLKPNAAANSADATVRL